MRFQTGRVDRVPLNLTSLIDVVFILLMFFIVSTTFNRYAHLRIKLLEISTGLKPEQARPLELAIDAAGDLLPERARFDRLTVRDLNDGS